MVSLTDPNQLYRTILGVMAILWLAAETLWSRRRRPAKGAQTSDRLSAAAIMIANTLGLALAFSAAESAPGLAIGGPRPLIFGIGIVVMAAGLAVRAYAMRVLGKYFTPMVMTQPEQKVIEAGPYRLVRHPSYSGALLILLGIGLALANWLSVLCALMLSVPAYSYRMVVEERSLAASLGEPYKEYMMRTKRIIPHVL